MNSHSRRTWRALRGLSCVAFSLLAACAGKDAGPAPAATSTTATPAVQEPTREQMLSAHVEGVLETPVTLAAGRYDGEPTKPGASSHPSVVLWQPTIVFADVDGQPGREGIALISSSQGGSGEFVHLGVFTARDGQARTLAVAPVGDRARLFRLWLEREKIHMDVVEPGPSEAACCGTQLARKAFALQAGRLTELEDNVVGSLSINLLAATDWMLVEMDGQPLAAGVLPPTALIQYGKMAGFAGCRRYTAPISEAKPGSLKLGELVLTQRSCAGPEAAIESQYLDRLAQVQAYNFQAGRLSLIAAPGPGGNPRTLTFSR